MMKVVCALLSAGLLKSRDGIQQGVRVLYRETHILLEKLVDATLDGTAKQAAVDDDRHSLLGAGKALQPVGFPFGVCRDGWQADGTSLLGWLMHNGTFTRTAALPTSC
jgi:hypothetical protein